VRVDRKGGVGMIPGRVRWKKSSYSGGEGTECVEIRGDLAAVRDSKNPAVALRVKSSALVAAVKAGQFDR